MTKKNKKVRVWEKKPQCIIEGCEKNAKKLGLYCRVHFWELEAKKKKERLAVGLCRFCGEKPVDIDANGKPMKSCAACRAESTEMKKKWREQTNPRVCAPAATLILNRYNMMDNYDGTRQRTV